MQTIQLIAQVDPDGVLRVQMPEGLKNVTIDATIVFTTTGDNTSTWADKSNLLSPSNSINDSLSAKADATRTERLRQRISWTDLIHSLAGAGAEDFPDLAEIRTKSSDVDRENL
jgi:hypothetical protein